MTNNSLDYDISRKQVQETIDSAREEEGGAIPNWGWVLSVLAAEKGLRLLSKSVGKHFFRPRAVAKDAPLIDALSTMMKNTTGREITAAEKANKTVGEFVTEQFNMTQPDLAGRINRVRASQDDLIRRAQNLTEQNSQLMRDNRAQLLRFNREKNNLLRSQHNAFRAVSRSHNAAMARKEAALNALNERYRDLENRFNERSEEVAGLRRILADERDAIGRRERELADTVRQGRLNGIRLDRAKNYLWKTIAEDQLGVPLEELTPEQVQLIDDIINDVFNPRRRQ